MRKIVERKVVERNIVEIKNPLLKWIHEEGYEAKKKLKN